MSPLSVTLISQTAVARMVTAVPISRLKRIKHYIGPPINLNILHIKATLLVAIAKLKIWEAILHSKTQND
jgi:hypothetical protein